MIPLSVPTFAGNEWKYVKECIDTGWVSSAGKYVEQFEKKLADTVDSASVVATVNGTSALHIALIATGCQAGDLVLLPNLTFVASANAIRYAGADPVLIDVHDQTWQLNLDLLEDWLKQSTELRSGQRIRKVDGRRIHALMLVHTLGDMVDMERAMALAEEFNLLIIEDASEALGSRFNGKPAGTFGAVGALSFNGNKIISTGGGGALMCKDHALAKQMKHLTTQAKVSNDEYFHDQVGYNYRMVNVLAAIGVAQLEQLPGILTVKSQAYESYLSQLDELAGIQFPQKVPGVASNNWLVTIRVEDRDGLINHLASKEILSRPLWVPMNQLPMFNTSEYVSQFDVAGALHRHCVSIPSSASLTPRDVDVVSREIASWVTR